MKQTTKIKTWKTALVELTLAFSTVAMALLIGTTVSADGPTFGPVGPSRPTYTLAEPAPKATWNSITDQTDLPAVSNGDERNFVWVREYGKGEYQDQLAIEGGKQYEVMMFYHNNAASNLNASDPRNAIMFRARVQASYPEELAAQEVGIIRGELMADNATSVWDEAWVISSQDITLSYVAGSAKLYNNSNQMSNPAGSGRILPSSLFSESGTLIGWHDLDGVLPGCTYYSGWIRYVIETETVEVPVTPEEPEEPVVPELPETGPVEVVGVLVGTTMLVIAVVYYVRSRQSMDKTI
jgi:hypothetical protein